MSRFMLYAGSDDGVYRVPGVEGATTASASQVLQSDRVYRLRTFEGVCGLFAATDSGLYHTADGDDWSRVPHPRERVYAVVASPDGERLYTGTKPAEVYVADLAAGVPGDQGAWTERTGLRELGEELDWGIERHDNVAQVRSLCVHPAEPGRLVAGVEVGGVHVSPDGGGRWTSRRITGHDAPHPDDIHHLAMPGPETLLASTGSGCFRSTDLGRSWDRLDVDHRQRYFREAVEHDGRVYAGAAPASSPSWDDDPDHALFEAPAGQPLEPVGTPVPEEHPIGWCVLDGAPVAATHRGTLLRRGPDGWTVSGAVPTPGGLRGRYLPLAWFEG